MRNRLAGWLRRLANRIELNATLMALPLLDEEPTVSFQKIMFEGEEVKREENVVKGYVKD